MIGIMKVLRSLVSAVGAIPTTAMRGTDSVPTNPMLDTENGSSFNAIPDMAKETTVGTVYNKVAEEWQTVRKTITAINGQAPIFTINGQCEVIVIAKIIAIGGGAANDDIGVTTNPAIFCIGVAEGGAGGFTVNHFWNSVGVAQNPMMPMAGTAVNEDVDANIVINGVIGATAQFEVYCKWKPLSSGSSIVPV